MVKKTTELFGIRPIAARPQAAGAIVRLTFAMILVCSLVSCGGDSGDNGETPYSGKILAVKNEQVWEHTDSLKTSEAYVRSTVNSRISIVSGTKNNRKESGSDFGFGEIEGGILNFSIGEPGPENLLSWNDLKDIFYEWQDVAIGDEDTMGTIITLVLADYPGEMLNREKLVGTRVSLGLEYIHYIYADRDCKITGNHGEGLKDGVYYWYTDSPLDLSLKEGWNLLCRKEVFGQSGNDIVSMEIKNIVDFRWAIWQ